VLVRENGVVVCHVGLYGRDGMHDGVRRMITGIGGVMTAPGARRRGHAGAAMREAAQIMRSRGADFGLLFCEPHNEPLYESLGWRKFAGDVFCEQPQGRICFNLMAAMILPVRSTAETGVIDLCGLPW
jgi:hypothetical protein